MAVWPLLGIRPGVNITNPFGARQVRAPGFTGRLPARNNGLDIGAALGTPVVAPVTGKVVQVLSAAGQHFGYGNSVLIEDAAGNRHRLSHLQAAPLVGEGATVREGQRVGAVGVTGNSTGPHLDYEFRTPRGFADPLRQEFVMAATDENRFTGAPPGTTGGPTPGTPAPSAPSAPGGPGSPGGPGDDRDTRQRLLDAIAEIDRQLAGMTDRQRLALGGDLQNSKQNLLDALVRLETASTPSERTAAQDAADQAQARYYEAVTANVGVSEAVTARGQEVTAETARRGQDITAGTAREVAGIQAATSRFQVEQQNAREAARLAWEQEQARIEQAYNDRRLTLEEATAASDAAFSRITAQLAQQRNAIETAALEAQQRGQDLQAGITQRGQDIEAGTAARTLEATQRGQELETGTTLQRGAQDFARGLADITSQTVLGSLPFMSPRGTTARFAAGNEALVNMAQPGAFARPVNLPAIQPTPFPFDPRRLAEQVTEQALARFLPQAQSFLGAGTPRVAGFVAPPQITAPPRVIAPAGPELVFPTAPGGGAGGGFVAPR